MSSLELLPNVPSSGNNEIRPNRRLAGFGAPPADPPNKSYISSGFEDRNKKRKRCPNCNRDITLYESTKCIFCGHDLNKRKKTVLEEVIGEYLEENTKTQ